MTGSWARAGNRLGVWMYRRLNGRLSSGSKKVHVLMITTPRAAYRNPSFDMRPVPGDP